MTPTIILNFSNNKDDYLHNIVNEQKAIKKATEMELVKKDCHHASSATHEEGSEAVLQKWKQNGEKYT